MLQAFDYLRTVADEPKRFQMLVLSLTDEPVNPIYQVKKINSTSFFERKSTRTLNLRINRCLPVAMVM